MTLSTPPHLIQDLDSGSFADTYTVPVMAQPPDPLDGLGPEPWLAAGFDGLNRGLTMDGRSTRIHVGASRTQLCFSVVSECHPDSGVLPGDSLEVLIAADAPLATRATHRLHVHPNGNVSHTLLMTDRKPLRRSLGRIPNMVRVTSSIRKNLWHCQLIIPSSLLNRALTTTAPWRINVCRTFQQPQCRATLAKGANDAMAIFHFTDTPVPAVHCQHQANVFEGDIRLLFSLLNPAPTPVTVGVGFICRLPRRPDQDYHLPVQLKGGERKTLMIKSEAMAALSFDLLTFMTMAGGPVLYARHTTYQRSSAPRWTPPVQPPRPFDFMFAYYPTLNLLHIRADIRGLPKSAQLANLHFHVRPKDGGPAILNFTMKARHFSRRICEVRKTMPPIEGEYEISACAEGIHTPTEPLIKTFERRRFEWEQQGLGTSRKVFPPFTPIAVQGNTVQTVLKTYQLSPEGLPAGIRTGHSERQDEVKELLSAPMRYVATVNGAKATALQPSLTFTDISDDRVEALSRFRMGDIKMESALTLDYDGTLRVDLTLLPAPDTTLDTLDLEIPLRGETARLVHASNGRFRDAIEFRRLPESQGVIWSSADIPPTGWEQNFCSYIFLGDANRGLCWFTDNSLGWSRQVKTPSMEVTRSGPEVTLRIHFINKAITLTTGRTITFGLLAAPVKPRLQGWRHRWYTERFTVLGCDCHWLSLGNYACFYPPGKDLSLWEAIRRGNREPLTETDIAAIINAGRKQFQPYGEQAVRLFENMAMLNLRNRYGTRMIFYYNRDVTAESEEYRTFMDEWGMDNFIAGRDLLCASHPPSRRAVGIAPTASHIDFILHWYGRSFETSGNTGVYMDNLYFRPFRNPITTSAYRDDDGAIVPSTGIWALREQAKRTFTFLNERGMEPIHMGHMTSLACLPILAFYTIQYDWEWQRGFKDVHDRFSREYLQLVSSGELAGTWPIVLHELGEQEEGMMGRYAYPELRRRLDEAAAKAENPWLLRTFLGVTLVHELLVDPYRWHYEPIPSGDTAENRLFDTFRRPILELVQNSDCEVYRYWDARPQPVQTGNPDLPAIVFVRPGREALIAITNYADSDQTITVSFDFVSLGFKSGGRVLDVETNQEFPIEANRLDLSVKQHDLRELRILPG